MRYSSLVSLTLLLKTGTVLAKPILDGIDSKEPIILDILALQDLPLIHDVSDAVDGTLDARDGAATAADRGSFAVDLVRNDAYRKNGAAELAWAYAKYNKNPAAAHTKTNNRVSPGPIGAYNQSYDREYLSPIYMGTPGQLCWLDIDTGSGDLCV